MSYELRNEVRTEPFRRNDRLESLLQQLNEILHDASSKQSALFDSPKYPSIFIVGGPRSGTTLMMQWLASSGLFGYPSNLMARFYRAPYIGALIHEMMFNPDYQYKDDFSDLLPFTLKSRFESDLGKTIGASAPNVFWYFWRRFFKFADCPYLNEAQQQSADTASFVKELAAIESAFNKPFALKGIIVNWNLEFIDQLFEKALFIHVRREPAYQMKSILNARARFRGDRKLWWGFKTPEFEHLKFSSPEEEVAAQIFFTRRAISKSFDKISDNRWMNVDYEHFCTEPQQIYRELTAKLSSQQYELPSQYPGTPGFSNSNGPVSDEIEALNNVYRQFGTAHRSN
ncbi:MAG: sulfotransferase [Candidatus Thiodiazotropha lotti]|nr:sulfotransferase [Candidatus Thiodiazotropha lotti]